jgi:hypothetical protein
MASSQHPLDSDANQRMTLGPSNNLMLAEAQLALPLQPPLRKAEATTTVPGNARTSASLNQS